MPVTSVTLPPAFAVGTYNPAFNPTQTGTANQVSGEEQIVSANAGSDTLFVVPSYAPFFATTMTVTFTPTGGSARPMTSGVDYFFALPFISGSRSLSTPMFGALVMANNQLAGALDLAYTTLGGVWVNTATFNQNLETLLGVDLFATAFEQVAGYTSVFPPVNGPWDKTDPVGMPDVIESLVDLINQIETTAITAQTDSQLGIAHMFNTANPHVDTAAGIGLGSLRNLPAATDVQAADSTNDSVYVSPAQLKISFAAGLPHAQDALLGVFELNDASQVSDPTDASKVLTAASFAALVQQAGTGISTAFNRAQVEATFSPLPLVFPVVWRGTSYPNLAALLQGISNFTGVSPLEYSATLGKIWFPVGTPVPSLVTPS